MPHGIHSQEWHDARDEVKNAQRELDRDRRHQRDTASAEARLRDAERDFDRVDRGR